MKIKTSVSSMLDFIRGLASQIVVIGHGLSFLGLFSFLHYPNIPWMQNIAVVVFFLLSGFVISYVIDTKYANTDKGFSFFVADRFSRIYPPLIIALIVIIIIDVLSRYYDPSTYRYAGAFNIETLIANLFMLQDFSVVSLGYTSFASGRPLWTLAVEWWIYIFVGYALLSQHRKNNLSVYLLIVLLLSVLPTDYLFERRGNGLFLTWMLGSLSYFIFKNRYFEKLSIFNLIFLISVFLISAIKHVKGTDGYGLYFSFYLSMVFLLFIELSNKINFKGAFNKISEFLASYAYTLYLIHYSIFDVLNLHFEHSVSTFLFGYFISNFIAFYLAKIGEFKISLKTRSWLHKMIQRAD